MLLVTMVSLCRTNATTDFGCDTYRRDGADPDDDDDDDDGDGDGDGDDDDDGDDDENDCFQPGPSSHSSLVFHGHARYRPQNQKRGASQLVVRDASPDSRSSLRIRCAWA